MSTAWGENKQKRPKDEPYYSTGMEVDLGVQPKLRGLSWDSTRVCFLSEPPIFSYRGLSRSSGGSGLLCT